MYIINGNQYFIKDKYTLKEWGLILKLLASGSQIPEQLLISLLAEDKLKDLLNLILDKPIMGELYEDDIETIVKIINDFFGRSKSLIPNIAGSSTHSTKSTKVQ